MRKVFWGLVGFFCLGVSLLNAGTREINLELLLERMVDLDWLYLKPLPGEKQIQFSSYDRRSRMENGIKLDWYANADAGNYLAEERKEGGKEYVMAEFNGPGYIARIWSANPGKGLWRIYLDGSESPVIEEPGVELLSGRGRYFKGPFAGKRARGKLMIFPIPFQKSCKVTLFSASPNKPSRYYQIDIISLPPDSLVESFQLEHLKRYQDKIQAVAKVLKERQPLLPSELKEVKFSLELEPGREEKLVELQGSGVIRMIEITLDQNSLGDTKRGLNLTVLTGKFDELAQPCIHSPLGAFFGSAPALKSYSSLTSSISWEKKGKMVILKSFWPMPFKKSASFSLANYSQNRLKISGRILREKKALEPDLLYFHSSYRSLNHQPTRPFSDWTLLETEGGAGRYVGTMLSVRNPDYMWWGEGDEKVYVDKEDFPSIFGTGTEDYFSYAWGARYEKFDHAYYGIPFPTKKLPLSLLAGLQTSSVRILMIKEKKQEMVSQYRWQIIDQIPFHNSIKFDLELWHWTPSITFDLQAMSYWYGSEKLNYNFQKINPDTLPNW